MYFLYSILLAVLGALMMPAFVYRSLRHRRHPRGIGQRLGRLPETLKSDGRETIWFHSCSVGETLSLNILVRLLHKHFPGTRFVFSTITETGQQIAIRSFSSYGQGNVFYFPIDFGFAARRVLDWIRPAMLIIVDTEIWPNTIHQARRRGIPVVLVNGRISASSFRYYRWARPILGGIFRNYSALMMQSEDDAARIHELGAPAEKVSITGNLKFDDDHAGTRTEEKTADELEKIGFDSADGPLIVAGSTHPEEEQALIEAFRAVRSCPDLRGTRLLLAPRHPERFDAVARMAARNGFTVRRRTNGTRGPQNSEILLLDSMGELSAVYRFATVVFVGGSLIPHGGHSILEPARHSRAIVIGPYTDNFRQITGEFLARGGVRQITAGEKNRNSQIRQLTEVFQQLLHDSRERETLGAAAFSVLEGNRGAARRTFRKISAICEEAGMNLVVK